jgi:hypothetical protein
VIARPITIVEPQIRQLVDGHLTHLIRPHGLISRVIPGDRLWVREPFWLPECYNHVSPSQANERGAIPNFFADHAVGQVPREHCKRRFARELLRVWHRQYLLVRAVTAKPLQFITDEEASAQGFADRSEFAEAWDRNLSLTPTASSWKLNPEVIAIDFERVAEPLPETPHAL